MKYFIQTFAILVLLILVACNKEKNETEKKYEPQSNISSSPNSLSEKTEIKPFWEKSKSFQIGSKGKLSIIPFDESALFKIKNLSRRMLVRNDNERDPLFVEVFSKEEISEDTLNVFLSNFFSSEETVAKKMIGDFDGTILIYNRNKKYQKGLTYNKKYVNPGTASYSLSKADSRVAPDPVDCWYIVLTTTYIQYYPDGSSYTWTESTIIGSFCNNSIGPSGGGGYDECNASMANLINDGTTTDETQSINTIQQGPNSRTKNYVWTFFKSNGNFPTIWRFDSHETGIHIKTNNVWKWQSLQHDNVSKIGFVTGGNVSCQVNSSTPTLGTYWSIMALNFNIEYSIVCQNFPVSSSHNFIKSKPFNVEE